MGDNEVLQIVKTALILHSGWESGDLLAPVSGLLNPESVQSNCAGGTASESMADAAADDSGRCWGLATHSDDVTICELL